MRSHNSYNEHRNKLLELGLDLSRQIAKPWQINILCEAIKSFKNLNNHVKVPQKFVIPIGSEEYPESTWGMKLGQICNDIQNKGCYAKHKLVLTALGISVGGF